MEVGEQQTTRKERTVLLSGGTSGIGRAAAQLFVEQGWRVYELSRRAEGTVQGAVHLAADVTDAKACADAVGRMLSAEGRIDALVNNAGVGAAGAAETMPMDDARRDMEVNFFGAVTLTRLVLPAMREQCGGRIVNVASAAAMLPTPFQSFYAASKAALLAWGRALSGEVAPFGIKVTTVCPGDAATGFTAARRTAKPDGAYGSALAAATARMAQDERDGGEVAVRAIAAAVVRAACGGRAAVVVPGWRFAALAALARLLPAGFADRLVARHYGVRLR